MCTRKWPSTMLSLLLLVCLGVMAPPASSEIASDGPKVGQWKTWVLASGNEIEVPAPPADTSDQTKAELAELRRLQQERSPMANTAIQYYNAVPATQRWHDLALALARAEKQSPNRQARLTGILHTGMYDAVVATWAAKYRFNRTPPGQLAPDVTPAAVLTGAGLSPEPPYPSEHAALAGTAVTILTAFFPQEEAKLKGTAAEGGDAAADRRQLPQRPRGRLRPRPGGGAEGARPRRHRRLGRQVDRHGADRAGDVGREGPAGAADGHLEAVADGAG